MNFGIAFFGVCGIAGVGILDALESMEMRPQALFLNDNSVLPVYLYSCGMKREIVTEKCLSVRSFSLDQKKRDNILKREMGRMCPRVKLYISTELCDYTTEPTSFPNVRNLRAVRDGFDDMIRTYRQPSSDSDLPPQTWPLTNMGCERILLVSPYCCRTDYKCNLHIRLPAYDPKAMEDLALSYFQGYRAAEHNKTLIYEKLLF